MDTSVTNASVEELTESYGDVGDLGVATFVSNNSYDTYNKYRSTLGLLKGIMETIYNCCNVVIYYLIRYLLMLIKNGFFWLYMLLMRVESNADLFKFLKLLLLILFVRFLFTLVILLFDFIFCCKS